MSFLIVIYKLFVLIVILALTALFVRLVQLMVVRRCPNCGGAKLVWSASAPVCAQCGLVIDEGFPGMLRSAVSSQQHHGPPAPPGVLAGSVISNARLDGNGSELSPERRAKFARLRKLDCEKSNNAVRSRAALTDEVARLCRRFALSPAVRKRAIGYVRTAHRKKSFKNKRHSAVAAAAVYQAARELGCDVELKKLAGSYVKSARKALLTLRRELGLFSVFSTTPVWMNDLLDELGVRGSSRIRAKELAHRLFWRGASMRVAAAAAACHYAGAKPSDTARAVRKVGGPKIWRASIWNVLKKID